MSEDFKIEYEKENKYLNDVLNNLDVEINDYLKSRKKVSDVIVDYRKKFIEEYRDDDDKIIEYFDHENHKNEHIFTIIEKRIKELAYLKKSPYFGKIKVFIDGESENFYIGTYGFDGNGDTPFIIDLRAPISSLFYQGKLGNLSYFTLSKEKIDVDLLERRQFLIRNSKIVSMFDSDIDVKDEFLKEMLSLKVSNKLKNIVQTIQLNQDKIIRLDEDKTIILNGIAGSGKTSIALHRIAYLLYNFHGKFNDRVLILGPNKIFIEYISSVLPSLGEYTGIFSFTSEDFIYLNMEDELNFNSFTVHMEKILKDRAYREEFVFKGSFKMKQEIDDFLKFVEENMNFGSSIYFRDECIITGDEINKLFCETFKSRVLEVRVNLIRRKIIDRINKIRNKFVYEIVDKYNKMNSDEDMVNYNDMMKKNEIYEIILEASELKQLLHFLKLESPFELYKEFYENFFAKDLNDLDFGDLILIKYIYLTIYNVKKDRYFKLVVVDEAQDYSYMFYEVLKKYTKALSYIVVGDLNQSIVNFDENFIESSKIFSNVEEINIIDSYRSTRNINDYALKYSKNGATINSVRDGEEVVKVSCGINDFLEIFKNISDKHLSEDFNLGIIVRDRETLKSIYDRIKDVYYVKVIDSEDYLYSNNGIFLTTVYFSKGLEFDNVIIIDNDVEDNLLYIMLTRAMHKLIHIKLEM